MSRRAKIIAGGVLAIVLAVVAAVLWWTLRGEEPAAVDLGAAVAQLDASANGAPETESVEAGPEAGGEGAAPVAEDAGAAPDDGSEVADVAPDVPDAEDVPSGGAEGEPERAADAGSDGGEGAAPDDGPEVTEDAGAAPDDGSEVADVAPDVSDAEDVPSGGAEGEPERTAADAGPDGGGEGTAPAAEDVGAAADGGSEVADGASDVPVSDDAPPSGSGTEPETPPVDAGTSGLAGLWKLITAEGADALAGEGAVSFAGFRVQEVLAGGIGENTAVGRTAEVSGYIELTDAALVTTKVIVDMGTLRTDDSHRDHHMREVLDTGEFPLAAFTLTEPIELPAGSAVGEPFSGSARGDLTIKGVTNRAVFDLQAQLVGDVIVVVGSSDVVFSDFGVPTPTSAAVLSVEDHGVMEFQLYFAR